MWLCFVMYLWLSVVIKINVFLLGVWLKRMDNELS